MAKGPFSPLTMPFPSFTPLRKSAYNILQEIGSLGGPSLEGWQRAMLQAPDPLTCLFSKTETQKSLSAIHSFFLIQALGEESHKGRLIPCLFHLWPELQPLRPAPITYSVTRQSDTQSTTYTTSPQRCPSKPTHLGKTLICHFSLCSLRGLEQPSATGVSGF